MAYNTRLPPSQCHPVTPTMGQGILSKSFSSQESRRAAVLSASCSSKKFSDCQTSHSSLPQKAGCVCLHKFPWRDCFKKAGKQRRVSCCEGNFMSFINSREGHLRLPLQDYKASIFYRSKRNIQRWKSCLNIKIRIISNKPQRTSFQASPQLPEGRHCH